MLMRAPDAIGHQSQLQPVRTHRTYCMRNDCHRKRCILRAVDNRLESLVAATAFALLVETSSPLSPSYQGLAPRAAISAEAPAAVVVEARTVLEAGDATLTASSPAPALADTVVTTSVLTAKGGGSSGSGGGFLGLFTKRQKTNDVVAAQPLATEVAASSEQGPRTMPTDSSRDVSSGSGSSRAVEPQGQRSVTERQPAMESADAGAGVVVAGGGSLLTWLLERTTLVAAGGLAGVAVVSFLASPANRAVDADAVAVALRASQPLSPSATSGGGDPATATPSLSLPVQNEPQQEMAAARLPYGPYDAREEYPYGQNWEGTLPARAGSGARRWSTPQRPPSPSGSGASPPTNRWPLQRLPQAGRGPRPAAPSPGPTGGPARSPFADSTGDYEAYSPPPGPYYGPPPPWWWEQYAEYDPYGMPYARPPPPPLYRSTARDEQTEQTADESVPGPAPPLQDPYYYYYGAPGGYWGPWDAARRWGPRPPYDPHDGPYPGYDGTQPLAAVPGVALTTAPAPQEAAVRLELKSNLAEMANMDEALLHLQEQIDELQGVGGAATVAPADGVSHTIAQEHGEPPQIHRRADLSGWRQQLEREEGQSGPDVGDDNDKELRARAVSEARGDTDVRQLQSQQQRYAPEVSVSPAADQEYGRLMKMWREAHPEEGDKREQQDASTANGSAAKVVAAVANGETATPVVAAAQQTRQQSQQQRQHKEVELLPQWKASEATAEAVEGLPQQTPLKGTTGMVGGSGGGSAPLAAATAGATAMSQQPSGTSEGGESGASGPVGWFSRMLRGLTGASRSANSASDSAASQQLQQSPQPVSVAADMSSGLSNEVDEEAVEQQRQQADQQPTEDTQANEQIQAGAALKTEVEVEVEVALQGQLAEQQQQQTEPSGAAISSSPTVTAASASQSEPPAPVPEASSITNSLMSPPSTSASPPPLGAAPKIESIQQLKATSAAAADRAAETLARIRAMRAAAQAVGPRSGSGGRSYSGTASNGNGISIGASGSGRSEGAGRVGEVGRSSDGADVNGGASATEEPRNESADVR